MCASAGNSSMCSFSGVFSVHSVRRVVFVRSRLFANALSRGFSAQPFAGHISVRFFAGDVSVRSSAGSSSVRSLAENFSVGFSGEFRSVRSFAELSSELRRS